MEGKKKDNRGYVLLLMNLLSHAQFSFYSFVTLWKFLHWAWTYKFCVGEQRERENKERKKTNDFGAREFLSFFFFYISVAPKSSISLFLFVLVLSLNNIYIYICRYWPDKFLILFLLWPNILRNTPVAVGPGREKNKNLRTSNSLSLALATSK